MNGTGPAWPDRKLHFIGVGGAGMSGLALAALELGAGVTGSDRDRSSYFERLERAGGWPRGRFRERAALHWAEQVTRLAIDHPDAADFEALRPHFSDREIVDLTFAIGLINVWNRLAVGFAVPVARREMRQPAA